MNPMHNSTTKRGGFTLLEMTVAVAVLGVGLIMVAAFFPAALLEHQRTVDESRAQDLTLKAEAMLHNRLNPSFQYVNQADLAFGYDSPWYAMPFVNMNSNPTPAEINLRNEWDSALETQNYYNLLNNIPDANANPIQLFGIDQLSDDILPRNGQRVAEATNRLVWYGFYRTLATGKRDFTVAVVKQRKNQQFAEQDMLTAPGERFISARAVTGESFKHFPVPWRVTVGRIPGTNVLSNGNFGGLVGSPGNDLAALAPRGSRIMIHGRTYTLTGNGVLDFPLGRILTVTEAEPGRGINILQDMSDIPAFDASADGFRFDIWVFPPPVNFVNGAGIASFDNESPLLQWKVGL